MPKVIIKVLDNGPNIVEGDVDILDGADKAINNPGHIALCRCGLSTNMPFCTGAHQGKLNSIVRSK